MPVEWANSLQEIAETALADAIFAQEPLELAFHRAGCPTVTQSEHLPASILDAACRCTPQIVSVHPRDRLFYILDRIYHALGH